MLESSSPADLAPLWEEMAASVREQVSPDTFARWFKDLVLVELNDQELTLQVPNKIYQFWIESNYLPLLDSAMLLTLRGTRRVKFVFADALAKAGEAPATKPAAAAPAAAVSVPLAADPEITLSAPALAGNGHGPQGPANLFPEAEETLAPIPGAVAAANVAASVESALAPVGGLNPRNTFETFVVGVNNQFAHAACVAVSEAPAKTYNPLFIYGGVGLGKTHLMHAIGHQLRNFKKAKVLYVTSEVFTNEFIEAIGNGSLIKFRKRYRQADVLLIDDIQFLAGKERSQEEFFHTFNTLFDHHKQVVLSSDRPPAEIQNLEARLVSRFEWGLTAELLPPDVETRVAILNKKAQAMHIPIAGNILEFLASRIRTNVRRLEGALMRVASFASLNRGTMPTQERLEVLLKDLLQEEARRGVTIDQIKTRVAEHFDVRLADMTSKRRPANIAFPRQVAMYFARELTKSSLCEIGEAFGGRDHGTVIHAHRLVKERVMKDEKIRQVVSYLDAQFQR